MFVEKKLSAVFVLLFANLSCFTECHPVRLGAIKLPVEVKRAAAEPQGSNDLANPPPKEVTREETLSEQKLREALNPRFAVPPPKEMTRRELRPGALNPRFAVPPPKEMTRRELRPGDVIENDIQLDDKLISVIREAQAGNTKRGAIYGGNFRWPATTEGGKHVVKIPYSLENSAVQSELTRAIEAYNEKTCIRFVPRSSDADYLRIYAGSDCRSSIGRQMGSQDLSLGSNCNYMGVIIHELMHALGFLHEQSRTDRDNSVTVNYDNMPTGNYPEYNKYDQDTLQQGFDYVSIQCYQTDTGSTNGKPTMVKNGDPTGSFKLGNKDYFSAGDLKEINMLYGCSEQGIDNQDYVVTVVTGTSWGAGTNNFIYIDLVGTNNQDSGFSSVGTGEGFDDFESGMKQTFNVEFKYVGAIAKIKVSSRGGTYYAAWDLAKVTITDPKTKTVYTFNCGDWINDAETKTIAAA